MSDLRTVKKPALGLTFARSLPLRRVNVAKTLSFVSENSDKSVSYKELWESSDLGSIEAQATKRWLQGFGLVSGEEGLSHLGSFILFNDPSLSELSTQWILHYEMVCPHGAGPDFWKWIWLSRISPDSEISDGDLGDFIKAKCTEAGEEALSENTYRIAARSFTGAYSTDDGLGSLQVLCAAEPQGYIVQNPAPVPWPVMAYVLADFWRAQWGETLSIPYANITGANGPAALMLQNSGQIGQLLKPMQEAGLLEVSRATRPWTVVRKWSDPNELLERVYRGDESDAAAATYPA